MPRTFALFVALAAPVIAATGAAAQSTIRIEPRPFYGATITIEEGVRVFRALPPDRYVIINPNNAPVSLNISESHVTENSDVRHYNEGPSESSGRSGGYYGGLPYIDDGNRRGRHGNHGRRGGGHGRGHGKPGGIGF